MERTASILAWFGIAAMVAAMVVGPFASLPDYSSLRHTTSELAGQNMPNAWIMRSGLAAYGLCAALAAVLRAGRFPAVSAALMLFGAGLIAAAFWAHVPTDPSLGADLDEDRLHSIASGVTGISFALANLARLWPARGRDALALTGLSASVVLPLAMVNWPEFAGLLQRAMFTVSFVFLAREFRPV